MLCESWYVFHEDEVGRAFFDEPSELGYECTIVTGGRSTCVSGEGLAGGTSHESGNSRRPITRLEVGEADVRDVLLKEGSPRIVGLVGKATRWVDVEAGHNLNSRGSKTSREATDATKNVNGPNFANVLFSRNVLRWHLQLKLRSSHWSLSDGGALGTSRLVGGTNLLGQPARDVNRTTAVARDSKARLINTNPSCSQLASNQDAQHPAKTHRTEDKQRFRC